MPRLLLALGVIVVAIVAVTLRRRRRHPQPVRLPPSADDPAAEVLAPARPRSREAGEVLDVDDLRWIVSVDELEVTQENQFNTVVSLDDTVSSYADVYEDGLQDALADQPGIDAADHVDREVVLVRSLLALPDVQAAAIRALLAINHTPQAPRDRPLPMAQLSALADSVSGFLAGHGFTGRLRMSPEHDNAIDPGDMHGFGFYRSFAQEHLVQVFVLSGGFGHHKDDGSIVDSRVRFTVEVVEPAQAHDVKSTQTDGCEFVAGERIVCTFHDWVNATVEGVTGAFLTKALPLYEATSSRMAVVERWVGGLPWHVPDRVAVDAARTAARWGFHKHARDLSRYAPGARKRKATAQADPGA